MKKIFCPRCGTVNPSNAVFCRHCGFNLKQRLQQDKNISKSTRQKTNHTNKNKSYKKDVANKEASTNKHKPNVKETILGGLITFVVDILLACVMFLLMFGLMEIFANESDVLIISIICLIIYLFIMNKINNKIKNYFSHK